MATINEYDVGDMVRVSAAFTNSAAAADPTAVTLKVKKPDTAAVTYTYLTDAIIIKDSNGNYHADLDIDVEGTWKYRWAGTGAVKAAGESVFYVRDSAFI